VGSYPKGAAMYRREWSFTFMICAYLPKFASNNRAQRLGKKVKLGAGMIDSRTYTVTRAQDRHLRALRQFIPNLIGASKSALYFADGGRTASTPIRHLHRHEAEPWEARQVECQRAILEPPVRSAS